MTKSEPDTIVEKIRSLDRVVIELGCGANKKYPGSIGIDKIGLPGVDVVHDVASGLNFLPDECADLIFSSHFLEHMPDLELMMTESYRILKKGGVMKGYVPHFSNPYYYSDYTHRTPFGLYTFCYFSHESPYKRKVPQYYNSLDFRIIRMRIIFYSPFFVRNVFKKILTTVFNSSRFMQEWYEGGLCYLFPAHELEFELEKI